jgi:NAD(P)-dependent dehydrogenase (short-subunit alcohol dehydrogenase family)
VAGKDNNTSNRKLDLAARAAWLYYIRGRTQDEIATELNVSRQNAQRLIALATSEGLIKFRMDYPITECVEMAERLKDRFGLVFCDIINIGLACGEALAEAGASVIVADISEELAVSGRDHLVKAGHKAQAIVLDVTKPADVNAAVDGLVKSNGAIDILVCNAGIARSDVPAEEVPDEHWLNVIDVNLNGVFWCCRAVGRHMLAKGKGSIVNVGSMSGFIVNKPQPQSYYNASKAGVHHLTKSLAAEWAERGVRVNSVAPTYIETSLTKFGMEDERMYPVWLENTPMRRVGQPEEIASVVLFLASDASSLLTGSIVLADGGYTCEP